MRDEVLGNPIDGRGDQARTPLIGCDDEQQEFYEKFSLLTNELATANRELAKKNDEIQCLNDKFQLFSDAVERSNEAIVFTDPDETIIFVNGAFSQITGYSAEDVIGRTPRILSSGHHDKEFYRRMWESLSENGFWHGEIVNRRKNGDTFPEFLTINTITNRDGRVSHYAGFFSDATTHKVQEAQLRKINSELEQFAYVTSHDLREPLRMISSYIGLIERDGKHLFDKRMMDYFGFVRSGAERMDRLILDVLAFSRVGRYEMARTRIDLPALIERVTAQLRGTLDGCGGRIAVVGELPPVYGVESEVERLFVNVLSNALKYCDQGRPPRIILSGKVDREMGVYAVADNGIGIEGQFLDRIFRMFQRLHAREAFGGGTGIGLAICRKVVENHGGRIWVESEPGRGSTFTFTLPLADSA